MVYPVAEKFKSIQGEGYFTGVPMAFIRFAGCSVGKKVCSYCDTDFDRIDEAKGGGKFTQANLADWVGDYNHVCLTGGEPLDRDIAGLINYLDDHKRTIHIETSGTVRNREVTDMRRVWLTVSPKPGWHQALINRADEIKVIYTGLGAEVDISLGPGSVWPSVDHAVMWSKQGKIVYLQPCNNENSIDADELLSVVNVVNNNPTLRLSIQMHKYIEVR